MILVDQKVTLIPPEKPPIDLLKDIEYAARNCYASQDKITENSCVKFVQNLMARGHTAPLEFVDLTFDITTSRAVMAELTRHRHASFCIESQRYIQEAKTGDITFIYPSWYTGEEDEKFRTWKKAMEQTELAYKTIISVGGKPQEAREVLPNSTACRIIMKANLREWLHTLTLRTSVAAYPQMRLLATSILELAHDAVPVVFDQLYAEVCN